MTDTTTHSTRLAEERQTTADRLEGLRREFGQVVEATVDSNSDDEHDPEGATIAYERSQVAALIDQAEQHLVDIDAALDRLAEGTYGKCVVCGREIPEERLEARPTARTCVEHAGKG
ncbi:TraR/DksA C4-type zinc finger protein [Intrasporangium calvum]|uniref:TraR/DksA C4-type zinc finger protein n=1 Tax=Intrasporangium calvum TaxID=53358 RepID=A0ABT5GHC6_9MICO|nr:TraR/DksA C4-type zinc finger protein [Intrasporangium calvum]MDC5697612.1 TraR/DksA C4-type zinc finger protein [Intrasporangium calvum]